jgi:hypothetical protein
MQARKTACLLLSSHGYEDAIMHKAANGKPLPFLALSAIGQNRGPENLNVFIEEHPCLESYITS